MTSQILKNDTTEPKSKASLLHHCSITFSSLLDHCFFQMVLCHQQMHNHTSNALQKDKISSMTSQNLANDIKEPKSKASLLHHCHITVSSLFDHYFLSNGLVSPADA
jgi:hypothetical protein